MPHWRTPHAILVARCEAYSGAQRARLPMSDRAVAAILFAVALVITVGLAGLAGMVGS